MAQDKIEFMLPVGRMVQGDLYEPNDKDADGNPLRVKNGPNAGQPRVEYFLAVAIPKEPGKQWWETSWGAKILQAGQQFFPQHMQNPEFSWKVVDGDEQRPRGERQVRNCDREGFPGNWIVKLASGFAPKALNANGTEELTQPGAIKCGYYVQVLGNATGNNSTQRPGLRLNPVGVALAGYGPEIVQRRDFSQAGFGGALPAGASPTPIGVSSMPAAMPGAAPAMPGAAPAAAAVPVMPGAAPAAAVLGAAPSPVPGALPGAAPAMPAAMPGVAVQPNPAFLQVPSAPAPAAPAPAAHQMTAKAAGVPYESWRAQGWTDQQLVEHGYMVA